VALERPGAGPIVIRPQTAETNGGHNIQQTIANPLLLGGPAAGTWNLLVDDVVSDNGDSLLQNARLTLHTTGGPPKIAPSSSWTSAVLDATTEVLAIDGITWDERVPAGATVAVLVRTCQQAGCSDNPSWSAAAKATPVEVPRGRYLQLRVDMTSNGSREPELHALQVDYRRSD
jgi:hypothetical protein